MFREKEKNREEKREKREKKTEHTIISHTSQNSEHQIFTSCFLMPKKNQKKLKKNKKACETTTACLY